MKSEAYEVIKGLISLFFLFLSFEEEKIVLNTDTSDYRIQTISSQIQDGTENIIEWLRLWAYAIICNMN